MMMDQTPKQRRAEERMRRDQERTERAFYEMMLDLAIRTGSWECCPFAHCRRARRCKSKQFSQHQDVPGHAAGDHVAYCIRMLSQRIMPACAALAWYQGLQDVVLDALRERVEAGAASGSR